MIELDWYEGADLRGGGDPRPTPEYADVRARLGPFDLEMLEVGARHPAWGDIHLGSDNALAPARGVPLLLPRLGEPVEPDRGPRVEPWWRPGG